ncbi:hypothetical protein ACIRD9_10710 [Streptomyces violaceus]|uniref:hypothetical protein n=1 Tax=Streptomyces violaceus TaxID=1936 RepID=UPI003811E77F
MPGWFRLDRTEGQERAQYVEKDTARRQLTSWLAAAGIPVWSAALARSLTPTSNRVRKQFGYG